MGEEEEDGESAMSKFPTLSPSRGVLAPAEEGRQGLVCAKREHPGVIRVTQSHLLWACVEGLGDTMLVLHVDSQTRACSKDQCFFLAVKGEVWIKESPDSSGTQRTRKKQTKPLGGGRGGIAVRRQMCHGPELERDRWDQKCMQSPPSLPKLELQGGSLSWNPFCRGE